MPLKKTNETFVSEVMISSPNVDLLEDYVSSVIPILCRCKKCGNEWKAHPRYLLHGINCPECGFKIGGGKKPRRTHEEFVHEMKIINPSIQVLGEYKNAQTKIQFMCSICGYTWVTTPNSVLCGRGCRRCAGLIPWTTDEFKKRIAQINSSVLVLGDYQNNRTKIRCRCTKCSYEWDANPGNLLKGHSCPRCGDVLLKSKEQFLQELKSGIHPSVEVLGNYVTARTPIQCRCKICDYTWEAMPYNLIRGFGCANCAGSAKKTTQAFVEQLAKIDKSIIVLDDYSNNHTKMRCKCSRCGNVWESTPANLLRGHGCQKCSHICTSFMEQFILSAFSLVFGERKVYSRDRVTIGMEIDIVFPEKRIAVEIGAWFWHKKRIARDIEKQKLCDQKGIRLFTIYDCCGFDIVPEFPDCLHYSYSLSYEEKYRTLKTIVSTLLDIVGVNHNFTEIEWDQISTFATNHSKRKSLEEYREELALISPQIEIIDNRIYAGRKVKCKCKKCGYEWVGMLNNLLRGSKCRKCLGLLRKTTEQFVNEVKQVNKLVDVVGEYINDNTPIMCKCKECGNIWEARPRNILKGCGCPKCKGKRISNAKRGKKRNA